MLPRRQVLANVCRQAACLRTFPFSFCTFCPRASVFPPWPRKGSLHHGRLASQALLPSPLLRPGALPGPCTPARVPVSRFSREPQRGALYPCYPRSDAQDTALSKCCSVSLRLLLCGSRKHVSRRAGTVRLVLAADGGLVWICCHSSFRPCIRTRKTARKRVCLTFDCLHAWDTLTLLGLRHREEETLLPTQVTAGPRGMETGASATRTRRPTGRVRGVAAEA